MTSSVDGLHVGSWWSCTRWCREAADGPCREQPLLSSKETDKGQGEESDEMNYAMGLTTPPPRAASTVYFSLDDDEDVLAAWPTPLVEVRPQMGYERHCGSGFELVLDVTVPQLGGELVEVPNVVSQVVEQNVDIPVHGGMVHAKSLFLALPAVSRSPTPVGVYCSYASIGFIAGGVSCTRASGVLFTSASCGFFCTRASCVSSTNACG